MSIPTVGDRVHYVSYGTPGGEYSPECRAAIVTMVGGHAIDGVPVVSLAVLNPTGMFFNQGVVHERMNYGGTWHWPETPAEPGMADDKTTEGFVPPAAKSLPKAALDSATKGASMLDAQASLSYGNNLLAHALVQLQRDGWLRDGAEGPQMTAHGKLPAPPDRRPYRRASESGGFEQTVYSIDPSGRVTRMTLRQVGWQGQSGAFYALDGDADPKAHEPGSYAPMCITAHADDCAPEDLIALVSKAGA